MYCIPTHPAAAGGKLNASQFYITVGEDIDSLDEKYTIFGEVAEGMDVVDAINEAYCDEDGRPYQNIRCDMPFSKPCIALMHSSITCYSSNTTHCATASGTRRFWRTPLTTQQAWRSTSPTAPQSLCLLQSRGGLRRTGRRRMTRGMPMRWKRPIAPMRLPIVLWCWR